MTMGGVGGSSSSSLPPLLLRLFSSFFRLYLQIKLGVISKHCAIMATSARC